MRERLRRAVFVVHLWVGLSLGLLAAVIGVTGSLLVFRHEIDSRLAPALLRVEPVGYAQPPEAMLAAVERAYPEERVQHLMMPPGPTDAAEFWMRKGALRVFVDPYSGRVLGERRDDGGIMGRLFDFHTELLVGERGKTVVGIAGIGLIVLCLSGIVVWWPRGRQRLQDHLKVKWRAGRKRANYDLHRAGGFYASWLLVLVSLTGVALVFPDAAKAVVYRATGGGEVPKKPKAKPAEAQPAARLFAAANAALPEGIVRRISFPAKPGDPLVVRKRLDGETHPNGMNYIYVDPGSAEVLRVDFDSRGSAAQQAMNSRYPLHIGAWAGLFSKLLHAALGLMPAVLMVTGLVMWRQRLRRTRKSAAKPPAEPALSEVPA